MDDGAPIHYYSMTILILPIKPVLQENLRQMSNNTKKLHLHQMETGFTCEIAAVQIIVLICDALSTWRKSNNIKHIAFPWIVSAMHLLSAWSVWCIKEKHISLQIWITLAQNCLNEMNGPANTLIVEYYVINIIAEIFLYLSLGARILSAISFQSPFRDNHLQKICLLDSSVMAYSSTLEASVQTITFFAECFRYATNNLNIWMF